MEGSATEATGGGASDSTSPSGLSVASAPASAPSASKLNVVGYDLEYQIGSGAQGSVWLASKDGSAKVAIKIMNMDGKSDKAFLQSREELDAMKTLSKDKWALTYCVIPTSVYDLKKTPVPIPGAGKVSNNKCSFSMHVRIHCAFLQG